MPRLFCVLLVYLSLLFFTPPASCQTTDFVAALSGDKYPLTIKLKDLDSSWRRLSVAKGNGMNALAMVALERSMSGINDSYYTHGMTIAVESEIFLVSYHYTPTPSEINDIAQGNKSLLLPQTPETFLTLSLINIRQISSLDDVQPYAPETREQSLMQTQEAIDEKSMGNLKHIGIALVQYTQDHDEFFPPMETVAEADEAIYPYLKDRTLFEHPGTHELYQVNSFLSHRTIASIDVPANMIAYYEASPDNDGKRAILFQDGHVERVEEAKWRQLKAASHVLNPPTPKGNKG